MRAQQQIWENEHLNPNFLPKLGTSQPSNSILWFFENVKDIRSGKVADLGSGKGRNAIYLAKLGFEVYCLDYVQTALDTTLKLAKEENLENKIFVFNSQLDKTWPFEDNFFDLEVDCFSSIDIETLEGRKTYLSEMRRTLKRGGYGLIAVVSAEDEIEASFDKGIEPNSTIWPNGKFQKNYTEDELLKFYKDFKIIKIETLEKKAFKLGKNYVAKNIYLILKNE